jgi:hypothetical protein
MMFSLNTKSPTKMYVRSEEVEHGRPQKSADHEMDGDDNSDVDQKRS